MKPLLLLACFLTVQYGLAQSLDYISVRKKNGRVIKNFFSGSDIFLQTADGAYLQGPIKFVRNDTVFLTLYDVRYLPTIYGGFIRDTLTVSVMPVYCNDIKRIQLNGRRSFSQRNGPSLLMLAGGGYLLLNILNGAFYNGSMPAAERIKRSGVGAGLFGLGYLLQKLFRDDGFSKPSQRIVYVRLSSRSS